jgi:ABC-type nitrate/sulfonate/bicarbonate transport system substrate-binding protein
MTAADNIVAYVEGQGEAPIGPQPEFFAFLGSDSGFLNLIAAPGIALIAELRGKTVSVDALTTGYAFVLLEILRRNGLESGDYTVAKVGGTVQRWQALQQGLQDATLLSTPYNIVAKAAGFSQLARGSAVLGRYQGNVAAARRSWAAANKAAVLGYGRAYVAAIRWLYEPANREAAISILRKALPNMTQELGVESYGELLGPNDGFDRDGQIDIDGLRTVLELRSRYARPAKLLRDPAKYFDDAYWRAI